VSVIIKKGKLIWFGVLDAMNIQMTLTGLNVVQ